jgi:MoxR-like ATPase
MSGPETRRGSDLNSQAQRQRREDDLDAAIRAAQGLTTNLETVVYGKNKEVRLVLSGLLAGGHVLLEDVPGTAKTILARAIAASVEGMEFSRIQCTPDLQPTDATGLSIFDQEHRSFVFQQGPLFSNVVLVDEINRATPKTQSALLEAMAEHQVTADGVTRPLPDPFLLIATENPIEYEGTFPLPEAQLDRFFLRATLGYPARDEELLIVQQQRHGHPIDRIEAVLHRSEFIELSRASEDVYLDDLLEEWIVDLVRSTRELEQVEVGASVRGSLALAKTAKAWALLDKRDHVVPADLVDLFIPVLGHRLVLRSAFLAETRNLSFDSALARVRELCLELAPPPHPDWLLPTARPVS